MESSPKGSPKRLDTLLVERGLAASRSSAQGMILSGSVRVGDAVVTKAGLRIGADQHLSVDHGERFVSRAGEKLDAAIGEFGVQVEGVPASMPEHRREGLPTHSCNEEPTGCSLST